MVVGRTRQVLVRLHGAVAQLVIWAESRVICLTLSRSLTFHPEAGCHSPDLPLSHSSLFGDIGILPLVLVGAIMRPSAFIVPPAAKHCRNCPNIKGTGFALLV